VAKWSSNFGQSQRHSMPGANKSANLAGEKESFCHEHLSKTRPNSRRALSLPSSRRDFPNKREPPTTAV